MSNSGLSPGISKGDIIFINGVPMTTEKVTSPTTLILGPLPWWKRLYFKIRNLFRR